MPTKLETYLTLQEATDRYKISAEVLTQLANSGKIKAVRLNGNGGGIAVAERDTAVVAAQIQAKDEGDRLVSINEAARQVGLNSRIVWQWYKNGWLKPKGYGPNRTIFVSLQQARVLADLRSRQGKRGRRLIPRGIDTTL